MALLTIEDLVIKRGERTIVDGVSFSLESHEKVLIRGSNGCGKTTLLKAIAGLLPYQKGSLSYRGKTLGWVPQEGVLSRFPIAVEEVVMIGMSGQRVSHRERLARIKEAMELTGSTHLYGRCFHHLSGGEKQRVSLARCLCQKSELLLLDEPASYLDRESRENLDQLLTKVQRETQAAILLVTHEQELFQENKWKTLTMKGGKFC